MIGNLFGIDIELHWSFVLLLLIFLLLSPAYLIFWILLFLFVLIHEFSHSLTAKHYNVKVSKIVLLPIGGMSVMDLDNIKPKNEFLIALAGPMANIVIGLLFLPALLLPHNNALYITALLLIEINLVLGLFNLIPGFPIDGGRILRSYLQQRMDHLRATELAVKASKITLAVFLAIAFFFSLFWKGYSITYREFLVLYDLIIAMFLYEGSQAELRSAYITKYAAKITVESAMTKKFLLIPKSTTLPSLYNKLIKTHIPLVVFWEGSAVKAVTKWSAGGYLKKGRNAASAPLLARDFGTEIPTVPSGSRLIRAIDKMRNADTGLVAVVKSGKIVGLITSQHAESVIALHLSAMRNLSGGNGEGR